MLAALLSDKAWLESLSASQPDVAELLSNSAEQQGKTGYFHTLREILQQPSTWKKTADQMVASVAELRASMQGVQTLMLTGSGSSEFAGDCVLPVLKRELNCFGSHLRGSSVDLRRRRSSSRTARAHHVSGPVRR